MHNIHWIDYRFITIKKEKMKKINIVTMVILIMITFSCKNNNNEFLYEKNILEIKLIDGSWTIDSFLVPRGAVLNIGAHNKGAYFLQYQGINQCVTLQGDSLNCCSLLRAGVIDYRIISKKVN